MKRLMVAATIASALVSPTTLAGEVADLYLNGNSSAIVGSSETSYGISNLFYITNERIDLIQIGTMVKCDNTKPNRINSKRIAIECIQDSEFKIIRRIKSQAGRDYIINALKTKGLLDWEGWKATAPNFIEDFKAIGNDEIL
ncbi:hypothetical protein G6Z92_02585 [Vibrio aestuarianus subsp. cardii]|uniref:hypothetical protein n=1 Tax=Vibrio aestuarianus TaxID=28171 RepID=UPI0015C533F6|nr:hypothetical protein [Vibrio aestuarianus]NGZ65876.1 hypothetical protein [Vibrio aestuarianus subsp. cardii]